MDPRGDAQLVDEVLKSRGHQHPATTKAATRSRKITAHLTSRFGELPPNEESQFEEGSLPGDLAIEHGQ